MDIRQIVGLNLRRARLERDLSQEELADEAGISTSFLSQVEGGRRSLTITKLQDLAVALRVPIAGLFSAEGAVSVRADNRVLKKNLRKQSSRATRS